MLFKVYAIQFASAILAGILAGILASCPRNKLEG